jgi:beta-N-acetylhexosaminidase
VKPSQTINTELAQKLGQMVMVGFRGLELGSNHPLVRDIEARHLGGVVLFDYDVAMQSPVRNIRSPEQVRQLTADLQSKAIIPLFIALDQEGGMVARFKETYGFPPTVSARYLGEVQDVAITRKHATRVAATLAAAGINVNFAPVVDLNRNPENPVIGKRDRSFSSDPTIVTDQAKAWIEAHHMHAVLCAIKHFPGHGSSRDDSHLGCVDVTDVWSPEELIPYKTLIADDVCDMIMTAHIVHTDFDAEWPATLSRPLITGLLRERLGYDGVVISDDLQMQAIASAYPLETTIRMAVEAGVDIVLFGNNMSYDEDIVQRVLTTFAQLVRSGVISRDRIERSYQRIVRLKARLIRE